MTEGRTQELYALGNGRSVAAVRAFLDHFLPDRKPCCEDYPVPECSDSPKIVLSSESEILEYLENHQSEKYGLYWDDTGSSSQAMVFYTSDGHVVFGLAEVVPVPAGRLAELARFVGARYAMFGWEQRPPDTAAEFIALCRR